MNKRKKEKAKVTHFLTIYKLFGLQPLNILILQPIMTDTTEMHHLLNSAREKQEAKEVTTKNTIPTLF